MPQIIKNWTQVRGQCGLLAVLSRVATVRTLRIQSPTCHQRAHRHKASFPRWALRLLGSGSDPCSMPDRPRLGEGRLHRVFTSLPAQNVTKLTLDKGEQGEAGRWEMTELGLGIARCRVGWACQLGRYPVGEGA